MRRVAGTALFWMVAATAFAWGDAPRFTSVGQEFAFDTGCLRGVLHQQGRSLGLTPVVEAVSKTPIAAPQGLLSPYRLLSSEARYGTAAWDWASKATLLADGAVVVRWEADAGHPFDLTGTYRWNAAGTLDAEFTIKPRQDLPRFELFLASYFRGFPFSAVYAQGSAETGGKPGFLPATKEAGTWQMFPRDEEAVRLIQDGRWKRPPHPVEWKIRPRLAEPLAMRRDVATGLTALVMAAADECFAVATPFGEEGHRSLYLCLFGRDLPRDRSATARARLVLARDLSEEQAPALFKTFTNDPPKESLR